MATYGAGATESLPSANGDRINNTNITAYTTEHSGPRFLIIGAGARGHAYARAVTESTNGIIAAVAEPIASKREALGRKYIWKDDGPSIGQHFETWQDFVRYSRNRSELQFNGVEVLPAIDGVFICVLDELHAEVILGLQECHLHIMCEKPLATTLKDCLTIYQSLQPLGASPKKIFSIGHVLRYSPHNMLLRKLLLEDNAIGEILSIEHTEPVGWWHFSHSYVRGNWRKESTTAPSLLTKSCHDIDFLLWLLCSPSPGSTDRPHLPSHIFSAGTLVHFKPSNKPTLAGSATNCLSCPAESECIYSARKIYQEQHLSKGNAGWPVHIVDPGIEDCLAQHGQATAAAKLRARLAEDYDDLTPQKDIDSRPWFGRCVYESANDVCDDQVVTITWEEDPLSTLSSWKGSSTLPNRSKGRGAKTATFHMIAFTEAQCERRGRVYGSKGEICYDSKEIRVYDFASKSSKTYNPKQMGGGHGGGDAGLARQYVLAVEAVMNGEIGVQEAQNKFIGCSLEEVIRSHGMVFAAEEARRERRVVDWQKWWIEHVENEMVRHPIENGKGTIQDPGIEW